LLWFGRLTLYQLRLVGQYFCRDGCQTVHPLNAARLNTIDITLTNRGRQARRQFRLAPALVAGGTAVTLEQCGTTQYDALLRWPVLLAKAAELAADPQWRPALPPGVNAADGEGVAG